MLFTHWISDKTEGGDAPPTAVFPWWSLTKTAMAAAALRLHQRKSIDLYAPLNAHDYTLSDLLRHQAGFTDYGPLPAYHKAVAAGETAWPVQEMLTRANGHTPANPPQTTWRYSNIGYLHARLYLQAATDQFLNDLLKNAVLTPRSIKAQTLDTRAASKTLFWPKLHDYDSDWVYPGCLAGTAQNAAHLIHELSKTDIWPEMQRATQLGPGPAKRPWKTAAYGTGLMCGETTKAGRAVGHSGAGPHATNAVYHFPDLPKPVTVAAFSDAPSEADAEWACQRIALELQDDPDFPETAP